MVPYKERKERQKKKLYKHMNLLIQFIKEWTGGEGGVIYTSINFSELTRK